MFKPGDRVERSMTSEEANSRQDRDLVKQRLLQKKMPFTGNAAAYMHGDEAYVVVAITKTGGLRLRGFCPQVSPKDVRISTRPVYR